jgi:PAP2 superfamily
MQVEERTMKRAALIALAACMLLGWQYLALGAESTTHGVDASTRHGGRTHPDVLLAWNERVIGIAQAEDRLLTLKGVRTAAMMHLAIHDALNTIRPRYSAYGPELARARGADPIAASAQAAYEVAVSQYPDQTDALRAELDRWLAASAAGAPRDRGVALGKATAAGILTARRDDGWDREGAYEFQPPAPGVYDDFPEHSGTPPGFVFGAGWALVTPFTLERADQLRAPPPPAIDSEAYAAAYNEVKSAGSKCSATRTPDQSHLAMWWKDFVENSHNRLARQLVAAERIDLWDAARLFALLNMGVMDAYIVVFENKFHYNHWRPHTAIRFPADDGNPATEPDPQWQNTHGHTYPFPSYPSAHGTACAAAMTTLADTFGDRYRFTMSTPTVNEAGPLSPQIPMQPPTRSFDSFSDAARECALSRVYLGIHFRYDSLEGNRLGKRVGRQAVERYLRRR